MTDEIEVGWELVEGKQKMARFFSIFHFCIDKKNHGGTENTKNHGEYEFSLFALCLKKKNH